MKPAILALALLLSACTTANEVYGPDGRPELLIACGASTPISVCHERAKDECPAGYALVDEHRGFNRTEIRVRCQGA